MRARPPLPEALSAPRHVPGALQGVQDAQDGFQDGPGRPPKPPRWPKMPPRRPKRPQRSPKSAPRGPPRGPKEANIIDFHCVFQCFSRYRFFELPTLQDGPRGPQDRPKTAQEAPMRAPRRPKRASKRLKRRPRQPKRAPRQPQERSKRGNKHRQFDPCARRGPQEAPRRLREAQRGPQEAPRRPPNSPQEASKVPPRGPREAYRIWRYSSLFPHPREPQIEFGGGRERKSSHQRTPRASGAPNLHSAAYNTPKQGFLPFFPLLGVGGMA